MARVHTLCPYPMSSYPILSCLPTHLTGRQCLLRVRLRYAYTEHARSSDLVSSQCVEHLGHRQGGRGESRPKEYGMKQLNPAANACPSVYGFFPFPSVPSFFFFPLLLLSAPPFMSPRLSNQFQSVTYIGLFVFRGLRSKTAGPREDRPFRWLTHPWC